MKKARRDGDYRKLIEMGPQITDMNRAIFDPYNSFKGSVSGMHEVLFRQDLMKNTLCLDPEEKMSEGQGEEITRVTKSYPHLIDDEFINEHIEQWKQQAKACSK